MTDDALALAIAEHAKANGEAETMEALADAWTLLAQRLGRHLPEHIRIAAELAGRDDILDKPETLQ